MAFKPTKTKPMKPKGIGIFLVILIAVGVLVVAPPVLVKIVSWLMSDHPALEADNELWWEQSPPLHATPAPDGWRSAAQPGRRSE